MGLASSSRRGGRRARLREERHRSAGRRRRWLGGGEPNRDGAEAAEEQTQTGQKRHIQASTNPLRTSSAAMPARWRQRSSAASTSVPASGAGSNTCPATQSAAMECAAAVRSPPGDAADLCGCAHLQDIVAVGADRVVDRVVVCRTEPLTVHQELELVFARRQVERHFPSVGLGRRHGVQEDPLRPGADHDHLTSLEQVGGAAAERDCRGDKDVALQPCEQSLLE